MTTPAERQVSSAAKPSRRSAPLARIRELMERGEWQQHRLLPDDSDMLTELLDELTLLLPVVEAAVALDLSGKGWPSLVEPSTLSALRTALAGLLRMDDEEYAEWATGVKRAARI